MVYDPGWDMPEQNWLPQSSFESPIVPPTSAPNFGTLVCIPPINRDWLPIIEGCLDQLRNPATWKVATDDGMFGVLTWVDQLKEMVSLAGPCCDTAMRLTAGCVLQFSTDAGVTWNDVTDWATNFPICVRNDIIAPIPPNPGPSLPNQHACNIAGYLAQEIIKTCMVKVVAYVGTTQQQVKYAVDVMSTIGFAFPITYAATIAFEDWYNNVVGQVLSQVEFASTDPALWSEVTCAIYEAIKTTGYVTAGNFAAVHANLAAMVYTYGWVPPTIAAWWNDVGIDNIRAMQNVGAVDVVDCTSCGNWCLEWDFNISAQGWVDYPGTVGSYHPPSPGYWISTDAGGFQQLVIYVDLGMPVLINGMAFIGECGGAAAGGTTRLMNLRDASNSVLASNPWTSAAFTTASPQTWAVPNVTAQRVFLSYQSTGADNFPTDIRKVKITGPGPNPFGLDNCDF